MDNQRRQANQDVIDALLNCSSSEEFNQILTAYHDHLDHDFLEVLDQRIAAIGGQDPRLEERLQALRSSLVQILDPRMQSYLVLIQQLMGCPTGEEERILRENSELVDQRFVELMDQVAEQLVDPALAGTLRQLAAQVQQALNEP